MLFSVPSFFYLETVLDFPKKFSWLDVVLFMCILGEFLSHPKIIARQIQNRLLFCGIFFNRNIR